MRQILMLTCGILFISSVGFAEDTTTETCANGAGTVIEGKVTGHKYCKSNNYMNWWNAHTWCDALGRRLFSLDDCGCSDTVANCPKNTCAELAGISQESFWWAVNPVNAHASFVIRPASGYIDSNISGNCYRSSAPSHYALCY